MLLFTFRQILKLGIFGKLGSRGTLVTINNIINRVFWVTIVALLAWLAVALFGKNTQQTATIPDAPEVAATIPAPAGAVV